MSIIFNLDVPLKGPCLAFSANTLGVNHAIIPIFIVYKHSYMSSKILF